MSELIISVSGLRGIVGQSLTADIAGRFAGAFVCDLPPGSLVVSSDGRPSGPMLAEAIHQAICSGSRDVIDAQIVATPTLGVLVREHKAVGGIQISASHNPAQYNGMKLFGSDGRVLSAKLGEKVLLRYQAGVSSAGDRTKNENPQGTVRTCPEKIKKHLSLVLATVDVPRIRARKFKVLLDSNHGAGSILGRRLLEDLGCQVTLLGEQSDGQFSHPPEPIAENLADVCSQVTSAGVDIGFCQDPDADRLAVIDESGHYPGEEYTLALCLKHLLSSRSGAVVTNCSTSRMSQDVAEENGAAFYHSAVGEANVADTMIAHSAVFGGEGNGGPIDPRVGYVRDSFVGMANILDLMAARKLPISRLVDELPHYEIYKTKVELPREKIAAALNSLEAHFSDAQADHRDGLRLDWPGRWLLVRPSNTEPIVRVIAEARSLTEAKQMCKEAADHL